MGRWSKQGCINSAREYDYLKTWIRERKTAYLAARDNGWLDKCTEHMPGKTEINEVWILEKCKASAAQYNTRGEWKKGELNAYNAARRNGWLDVCCEHMEAVLESWTLEKCREIAKKFKTRAEWHYKEHNSYKAAQKNGWLDECCIHMEEARCHVAKRDCIDAAIPYSSVDEFFKQENIYFRIAKENGWLPEIKGIFYERNARAWIEKNLGDSDGERP